MEIIKTTALITINETLGVQLIGFLIFVFIINRVMFRPVKRNMATRDAYFSTQATEIAALRTELETLVATVRAEEKERTQDAHRQSEERCRSGKQEADQVVAAARVEIGKLEAATAMQLETTLAAARKEIEAESRKVAREVMQRLLVPESVK